MSKIKFLSLNSYLSAKKNSSFSISAAGLGAISGYFLKKNRIGAVTTI